MLVHRTGHKSSSRESQGINAKSFSNGTSRPHSVPFKIKLFFGTLLAALVSINSLFRKLNLTFSFLTNVFCCSIARIGFTGKGATKDNDKSETCQTLRPLGHIVFTSPREKVLSNFILMDHLEPVVEVGGSLTRSHNHLNQRVSKLGSRGG